MSGEKVTLKMVNGERYACPAVGDDVILKGQTIEVEEKLANTLLEDSYFDASNNEHFYFEQVDPDAAEEYAPASGNDGEGTGDKSALKTVVRKARTKAAAK